MKLTIETAKKMYKSDDESIKAFALDNYRKEVLEEKEFPSSWEDLEGVCGEYIDNDSTIESYIPLVTPFIRNQNVIPKGLGQPILDLIKLLQLRDRYRDIEGFILGGSISYYVSDMFSFKKQETRDLFKENFKEEIESIDKLYR